VPSVFLPEGTRLRACFGGHHYFAQMEGAKAAHAKASQARLADRLR
jgi:hypothetical protein